MKNENKLVVKTNLLLFVKNKITTTTIIIIIIKVLKFRGTNSSLK